MDNLCFKCPQARSRNPSRIPVKVKGQVEERKVWEGNQQNTINMAEFISQEQFPNESDDLVKGKDSHILNLDPAEVNRNETLTLTKPAQVSCEVPDGAHKSMRSCAAIFPDQLKPAMTSEPEDNVKESSHEREAIGLNDKEWYLTKFLHGPPAVYQNRAVEKVHERVDAIIPSQKEYQSGGVIIEEIISDHNVHQKSSGLSVQDSHAIFPPITGGTNTSSSSSLHHHQKSGSSLISKAVMMKMPPIPEDSVVEGVPTIEISEIKGALSSSSSTPSAWTLREKQRVPSFHTVNSPKLPKSKSPSPDRRVACFNGPTLIPKPTKKVLGVGGGNTKARDQKKNSKVCPYKPPAPKRTYEETFLRKKAFAEGGPAALRPFNRETISYSPKEGQLEFQTEQKTVLTKVVTKTVTEYEVDEQGREKKISSKTQSKEKPVKDPVTEFSKKGQEDAATPGTSQGKKHDKNKKVTIKDDPASSKKQRNNKEGEKTPVKQNTSKKLSKSARKMATNEGPAPQPSLDQQEGKPSKKVFLRGHGKRKMEMPRMRSHSLESIPDRKDGEENNVNCGSGPCRKCRVYKSLLERGEETIRYLTELLGIKEHELELLTEIIGGDLDDSSAILAHVLRLIRVAAKDPSLNPLLAKIQLPRLLKASTSGLTATPSNNNTPKPSSSSQSQLPKFDMDEFIKKFFRSYILCSNDFLKEENIAPFDSTMLFRFVVAARDCISHDILLKLKLGFVELQRRYDALLGSRSSPEESLDQTRMMEVLDSYRRFVRFMYVYMKESLKNIEGMEKSTLPINPNKSEEDKLKQKLHYPTKLVLEDGVKYEGVFIPFGPVISVDSGESPTK